ncbi:YbhB/YbcL family Raf kinase inhibitor-like protein [Streptococcus chenjunshii]|uniref:YbhB/YbcL family Raf kinase inhibitor-like protein n=1 Tax=Streptococcus chenjunshii TaxID=2173853 RepID=A0A372KQD0_9STRE|nr:YbhB/YbcL family Raf kinase inhibitor-like protein [Streptococcus chenjunshii]AXQ78594.1 YbhB/YbcL family Raf kinase inhibitor-like protein [Streptococcus chenjunshii]RFU51942.1 YbhB/YbcL family Raf kinase inhibitor-like protein [Streptococcus chenjunshii]RFU54134.1 YbhB/YbcL family Raf kinase inhibitor-like protein [Streptococcus chenjunshii]
MKIITEFVNHVLPDHYSKHTDELVLGNAVVSFPFEVQDVPDGAKTLAWTFVDYDSIPVCGFAYIHWCAANVPANKTSIEADFSRLDVQHLHGKNSLVSKFLSTDFSAIENGYIGPYPPDKDHSYTLTVYALDGALDLENGFYMNELLHAIEGHVLAEAEASFIGRC